MKRFGKVLGLAVLTAAAAVFMGCPTPGDDTGGGLWDTKGIELIESLAGKSVSWEDGGAIKVPSSYAKRLQVGSKVIFELATFDNGSDGPYIELHVEDGSWNTLDPASDFIKYYDAKGSRVSVTQEMDETVATGRWKINVDAGTYYFEVTETNLSKLKGGFAFQGNFKLVKVGLTNLAEAEQSEAAVYSGDEITLKLESGSAENGGVPVLRMTYYRSDATDLKLTLSNVNLIVKKGDATVTTNEEYEFNLNIYDGQTPNKEYNTDISLGNTVLKSGDTFTIKLESATVDGTDDVTDSVISSIEIFAFDNSQAGNYSILSGENKPKLITKKNGAPISPAE